MLCLTTFTFLEFAHSDSDKQQTKNTNSNLNLLTSNKLGDIDRFIAKRYDSYNINSGFSKYKFAEELLKTGSLGGIVDAAIYFCELVKADPPKYGYNDYCEFLNDPEYQSITKFCRRYGCPYNTV